MKQAARESLDAYYREAGSWAEDQTDALRASRRVARIVAGIAVAVALCEALALIFLAPLKTVVPYTLLVDKQTGYVQELKPLDAEKIAPDAALTQSFLVQYVIARESYDRAQLQSNFQKVQAWSVETAKSDYVNGIVASNPLSPMNRLPASTIVETHVKSVSSLGGNSALVRFETIRRDAGGAPQPPASWVAVIRYRFSTAPMRAEDRFINPLGFQVMRYRRDQEAVTPPEPVPTPVPGSTQPQVSAPEINARPATAPTRRADGVEITL